MLGPVLLIAAGVVFLLNNLGYLPWAIWGQLWRLWPLVLIAIGLDMIFGRRSPWASLLIVAGVLAAGIGVIYSTGGFSPANLVSIPVNIPLANATSANVSISADDLDLSVGSLDGGVNQLASGTLQYYERRGEPRRDIAMSSQTANLRFEKGDDGGFSMFGFGDHAPKWELRFNRQTPMALTMNMGDGNATLNLLDLRVTSFDLRGDDCNATITTSLNAGRIVGNIEMDDGNLDVIVPTGVTADIRIEKDDGNIRTDSAFKQNGATYTIGDTNSKNKLDLSIKMDDGNVNLRSR